MGESARPVHPTLIDAGTMVLHLEPDLDPRKGTTKHKATIILSNGLMLDGIHITRGLAAHTKINIPEPCPLTNSAGAKLLPAALTALQRALVQAWIHDQITERQRERYTR